MQSVYVTEPSGYRRCQWRIIQQRAIIHWQGTWEGACVSKAGGGGKQLDNQIRKPWQYYTAKLYGDSTSAETGREIYYYDLEKREERLTTNYKQYVKTIKTRVEKGLSIEGWRQPNKPGEFLGEPISVPWEPKYVTLIKPW